MGFSAPRPTPNLEHQACVFITPPHRQGGPVIPPGTKYPFYSPLTTRMDYIASILISRPQRGKTKTTGLQKK
jgi:hypothetical protein